MKFSLPQNKALRIIFIALLIPFIFTFLPFAIGALIIWNVCKRVRTDTMRTVVLLVLLVPTLFVGSAWVLGVTQGLTAPVPVNTPLPAVQVTPTTNPTISPTFTPVPLVSPTTTRKVTPTPRAMKKIVVPSVTQAPDNIPTGTMKP